MKRRKLKPGSVREDGAPYGALPAGYAAFLADIKQRVRTAQVRAALAANRELIARMEAKIQAKLGDIWGKE